MTNWYCKHGDNVVGPFSDEQIQDLLNSGRLLPTDQLKKEGEEKWVEVRDLHEDTNTESLDTDTTHHLKETQRSSDGSAWILKVPTVACQLAHLQLKSCILAVISQPTAYYRLGKQLYQDNTLRSRHSSLYERIDPAYQTLTENRPQSNQPSERTSASYLKRPFILILRLLTLAFIHIRLVPQYISLGKHCYRDIHDQDIAKFVRKHLERRSLYRDQASQLNATTHPSIVTPKRFLYLSEGLALLLFASLLFSLFSESVSTTPHSTNSDSPHESSVPSNQLNDSLDAITHSVREQTAAIERTTSQMNNDPASKDHTSPDNEDSDTNKRPSGPPTSIEVFASRKPVLAAVRDSTSWAYITPKGSIAIRLPDTTSHGQFILHPPHHNRTFSEGLAATSSGYIDNTGEYILKPQFKALSPFSGGAATVGDIDTPDKTYAVINKQGTTVFGPTTQRISPFRHGIASVRVDYEEYLFINALGDVIVEPTSISKDQFAFGNGYVVLNSPHRPSTIYDRQGTILLEAPVKTHHGSVPLRLYDFGLPRNGLVSAAFNYETTVGAAGIGFITLDGDVRIPPIRMAADATPFSDGLAAILDSSGAHPRWGYIDRSGTWRIDPKYEEATMFSDGRAAVKERGTPPVYIDTDGRTVVSPAGRRLLLERKFRHGKVAIAAPGQSRWSYYDKQGQVAITSQFSEIGAFHTTVGPSKAAPQLADKSDIKVEESSRSVATLFPPPTHDPASLRSVLERADESGDDSGNTASKAHGHSEDMPDDTKRKLSPPTINEELVSGSDLLQESDSNRRKTNDAVHRMVTVFRALYPDVITATLRGESKVIQKDGRVLLSLPIHIRVNGGYYREWMRKAKQLFDEVADARAATTMRWRPDNSKILNLSKYATDRPSTRSPDLSEIGLNLFVPNTSLREATHVSGSSIRRILSQTSPDRPKISLIEPEPAIGQKGIHLYETGPDMFAAALRCLKPSLQLRIAFKDDAGNLITACYRPLESQGVTFRASLQDRITATTNADVDLPDEFHIPRITGRSVIHVPKHGRRLERPADTIFVGPFAGSSSGHTLMPSFSVELIEPISREVLERVAKVQVSTVQRQQLDRGFLPFLNGARAKYDYELTWRVKEEAKRLPTVRFRESHTFGEGPLIHVKRQALGIKSGPLRATDNLAQTIYRQLFSSEGASRYVLGRQVGDVLPMRYRYHNGYVETKMPIGNGATLWRPMIKVGAGLHDTWHFKVSDRVGSRFTVTEFSDIPWMNPGMSDKEKRFGDPMIEGESVTISERIFVDNEVRAVVQRQYLRGVGLVRRSRHLIRNGKMVETSILKIGLYEHGSEQFQDADLRFFDSVETLSR